MKILLVRLSSFGDVVFTLPLAKALREMEKSLRRSESTAFQKGTELDLFQNVMELRLEDATTALLSRVGLLEAALEVEREKRVALRRVLTELSAKTDGELARRLLAEAEILG